MGNVRGSSRLKHGPAFDDRHATIRSNAQLSRRDAGQLRVRGHPMFTVQWVVKGREKKPVEVEEFVVHGREVPAGTDSRQCA
jgi:hypothetical protein